MATATQFLAKPWVRWAIIGLVVVLLIVLPLILPAFANQTLARIGVFAVAVLGLNVVMGYTGQVSLGQIFFLGLGAYVTAYGASQDWNIVVIFLLACLIPAAAGLLVALAAARLGGLAIASPPSRAAARAMSRPVTAGMRHASTKTTTMFQSCCTP